MQCAPSKPAFEKLPAQRMQVSRSGCDQTSCAVALDSLPGAHGRLLKTAWRPKQLGCCVNDAYQYPHQRYRTSLLRGLYNPRWASVNCFRRQRESDCCILTDFCASVLQGSMGRPQLLRPVTPCRFRQRQQRAPTNYGVG